MSVKWKYRSLFLVLAGLNSSAAVFAGTMGPVNSGFSYIPHVSLQGGGFWASQGSAQHINIDGLIGDDFSVSSGDSSNGLVGVGLFWDVYRTRMADFSVGVDAFYLPNTSVKGIVTQEGLFDNLSYRYSVTNWPIFFGGRAEVHNSYTSKIDVTFDAGIGPNIIDAHNFGENSLDGGITLPDNIFKNHTSVAFAAMGGVGLKFNQLLGKASLECGYRFFYFGQGNLAKATSQVLDTLKTGDSYANAALCSITI